MGQKALGIIVAIVAGIGGYFMATKLMGGVFGQGIQVRNAPEPTVASGWKRFDSTAGGYSIHLPKEFTAFDPKSAELESIINEAIKLNPQVGPSLREAMASGRFSMMAMDLTDPNPNFARNVNATNRPQPGKMPKTDSALADFRKGAEKSLPPGANMISVEFVELPIGTMVKSQLEMQVQTLGGAVKTRSIGYVAATGKELISITFTCDSSQLSAFVPIVEKAMQTFRIKV